MVFHTHAYTDTFTIRKYLASQEGGGVGDDRFSYAIDGCRRLKWHDARGTPLGTTKSWLPGTGISADHVAQTFAESIFDCSLSIMVRRRPCSYKNSLSSHIGGGNHVCLSAAESGVGSMSTAQVVCTHMGFWLLQVTA